MSDGQILITGGDGYLGSRLALDYLNETRERVLLWMRARDEQEFQEKQAHLAQTFAEFAPRVSFASGDLTRANPFASVNREQIKAIVHAAAVTRFNVDEATARAVNVEGTEKLLRFADGCPRLEALGIVSSIYASGLAQGRIAEEFIEKPPYEGFANFYEWSKWAGEDILQNRFAHLPARVFRVATVICDGEDGRVTQQNAFHNTLKLLFYGLLSLVPGETTTPLYFVTGDFAAQSIGVLMRDERARGVYHIAHALKDSVTLGQLIDIAFETFVREDAGFAARRILKPLYADAEAFALLADGVGAFGGSVVTQSLESVKPFAPQLFVRKDVENRRLADALAVYRAPDMRELARRACAYLAQTKWGRLDHVSHDRATEETHAGA